MSERKYTKAAEGQRVETFLRNVLHRARLRVNFDILEDEPRHEGFENPDLVVKFSGPDVDELLTNKAELLLALEQLTMEVLRMSADEHARICFDANDYRMLRIEELRLSAMTAAEKVKKSRVPFRFNPMNSRERRIIHLALREETAVRSESAGIGPQRQVVIYPAGMPSQPDGHPAPAAAMRPRRRR